MARGLREYERKRDFSVTSEPRGGEEAGEGERLRFVVQEHHATRLHWDLRLEHEGALASWAVPNGIPQDPDENRKAVHTEDHPLKYLDFHGEIPKGEYGAGSMTIWDTGTYECHKWEAGKVIVTFHGERLTGRYALFRAGKDEKDWMIHRMDPPAEGREPMPLRVVPMLASLSRELPPDDGRWAFEIKWDGVRTLGYCLPGRLHLESRNLKDITPRYPELRPITRALGAHEALLDGEVVAFGPSGKPSFERLQHRMHQTSESIVKRLMKSSPVTYVIFDLLYLDGRPLFDLPYTERRELLESLELNGEAWQTPGHHVGGGAELLAAARAQQLEGIIAKRLDSRYDPGRRGGAWIKVKNTSSQELVIGGWSPGEGRRAGKIGSLHVGHFEDGELRYAGKVGTGFTERTLRELGDELEPLAREGSPFGGRPQPAKGARFVEPELVAEIEFTEWTEEGMLRHPSFKGLRDDKAARDVVREAGGEAGEEPAAPAVTGGKRTKRMEVTVDGRTLRLSNLDKVLYPQTGFTKGDVIDFYARVAPVLVPHLAGRPITLKRYPDGVEAEHFYEKRCPGHRPDWVQTARVPSEKHGTIDFCVVDDLPTLVWAANLASLEMHPLLAVAPEVDRPTSLVFDLDPGEPAGFLEACQVGVWIRGMLEQLGLQTFAKGSGSKGLQVYVPLNGEGTYGATKPFARAVAETLERQFPGEVVSRQARADRPGRVLVDWGQNDNYKTTVSVYSLRAKLGRPTVSVPLEWNEVDEALERGDPELLLFGPGEALERIERSGDLFGPVLTLHQELPSL